MKLAWTFKHWFFLRVGLLLGFRDRLRCPQCGAVGTWKPYGGSISRKHGDRRWCKRWLCKWCGFYEGRDGIDWAQVDEETGAWQTSRSTTEWARKVSEGKLWTPKGRLVDVEKPVNPWFG